MKLTKAQREWVKLYTAQTGFPPTLDAPTFNKFAWKNIDWFESWAKDVMIRISYPPTDENETIPTARRRINLPVWRSNE